MAKEMVSGTFRVDKSVKEAAEDVLQSMGMSLSTGINVFLTQVARDGMLPFRPGASTRKERKVQSCTPVSEWSDHRSRALERLDEREMPAMSGLGDLARRYDPNDPVVRKAIEITLKQGKFSTASLQTWLGKGHGFVSGLAIWLEEIGVIGPANGHKPREVLIRTMEEFEEKAEW